MKQVFATFLPSGAELCCLSCIFGDSPEIDGRHGFQLSLLLLHRVDLLITWLHDLHVEELAGICRQSKSEGATNLSAPICSSGSFSWIGSCGHRWLAHRQGELQCSRGMSETPSGSNVTVPHPCSRICASRQELHLLLQNNCESIATAKRKRKND